MNKYVKIGIFGFLIWLIPFVISFIIFPIREENRALFESIMPVILTLIVVILSIIYFLKIKKDYLIHGLFIGIIWFIISIIIDLIMFLPESSWHMSLTDYMADIGLTYLMIIIIPTAFGYLIYKKEKR